MRRPLQTMVLLMIAAAPASAADEKGKPNTLTPKEIADGWILLFDGQTTFGWKIDGEAKVDNGVLVLGGSKAARAETTTAFDGMNSALEVETSWQGKTPPSLALPGKAARLKLDDSSRGKFVLQKVRPKRISPASTVKRQSFEVPAGTRLLLRNVKCKPLGLKSVFNGKDLTGWKEIPGRRSKFTVTDKGELNIKDGNGDIQTEGQWADFILQLDVFSNGRHLNSGVFFRCLPGQFWSGYESQIRNQWQGDDRTKPVDFGTGGIYGRQPARKVVSSDREWFTKTIIA
ncbi:MAG: 3-keto-disaccharide hydrolase, partial [Planctomycetota bacterium]